MNAEGRAKVRIHISKIIPQKYFPVFARVRIQAPHVFAQKLIPQEFFPACIGFVPGGVHQCFFGAHLRTPAALPLRLRI